MNSIPKIFVRAPKWAIPRWWLVAYLAPPMLRKELAEIVQTAPDRRFDEFVSEHVHALVERGVEPPAEVAGAIMNLADDLIANRQMTIRTGDYIAVQNYLRTHK